MREVTTSVSWFVHDSGDDSQVEVEVIPELDIIHIRFEEQDVEKAAFAIDRSMAVHIVKFLRNAIYAIDEYNDE